ncbi:MAG: hypothetical protein LBR34_00740 [Prevotella sp.]|jgi:hypothetical protein|nr:hypothetical protein [Prevotella sp.]
MTKYLNYLLLGGCLLISSLTSAGNTVFVLGDSAGTHLSIDLFGGALVDFRLSEQSPNPYSWKISINDMPPNNRNGAPYQGHFLCLGRWGAPTNGEIKAGVPHNGQSGNQLWKIVSVGSDSLKIRSDASLDGVAAERLLCFDAANAVLKVTDKLQSVLSVGRLFNIVQHATIGAPFLSQSTIIDSNAGSGFMQHLSFPDPHRYEFRWPMALSDTLGNTVNLTSSFEPLSYVSTHLFDSETGWITAASPVVGTLIGYLWKTSDYAWLNLWHNVQDGQPTAKGLEFGTTGVGLPYQDLLSADTRFHGVNSFFFLDALEEVEKSFIAFQTGIPADYKGVKDIRMERGVIVLVEKDAACPRIIRINNKYSF